MAFAKYPSNSLENLLASAPSCAGDAPASPERGGAALGTNAKYKHTPEKVDPDTGEIVCGQDRRRPQDVRPMDSRIQRFALQSVARSLFPKSRIDKCLRLRQKGQEIQVLQSIEHKTASFSGLQTCGSVWR